jgi:mycothiol synthase
MRLPTLEELSDPMGGQDDLDVGHCALDEAFSLAQLLERSFGEPWDVERVQRELGPDNGVVAIYVLRAGDRLVGTASARIVPPLYPGSGYVHWVGVDPDFRGRALGRHVTLEVLYYFRNHGVRDAVLETDDFRLPAIRTYLGLGFVPEYRGPSDPLRWSRVMKALSFAGAQPASNRHPTSEREVKG